MLEEVFEGGVEFSPAGVGLKIGVGDEELGDVEVVLAEKGFVEVHEP